MKNDTYQNIMIDKNLFELEKINLNDIVIYSIIKGFTSNEKICFATNGYFAKHIKKNNDTVRKSITKLFDRGFITITTNYDYPPSNRVLATTEKIGGAYLKTDEGLLKNSIAPLLKISNNEINNNININTSTTTEKLKSNSNLIKGICKRKNISEEYLYTLIDAYVEHYIIEIKKTYKDDSDLFSHFKYWLDKYKPKEKISIEDAEKIEKALNWFINVFNKISNKEFLRTPIIEKRFKKQFEVGYTGEQMKRAIKNLYSSSPTNNFHINSKFKFATPEYLLKDNNLNTYLNFEP